MFWKLQSSFPIVLLVSALAAGPAASQGHRGMMMGNHGDIMAIHELLGDHAKITRTVKTLDNGVETTTESVDAEVARKIVEHTYAMKARMENKQPIRMWDPLFAELFRNAEKIRFEITRTEHGVLVRETSTDPAVVKLIQAHAEGVTEFVEKGFEVMHKEHPVPAK